MKNDFFLSQDVVDLVGIDPIYLNTLAHRKDYQIKASISESVGQKKLRVFSKADVYGIALVWMLFECGLRMQTIKEVLMNLVDTDRPDANAAAEYLSEPGRAHLVIIRESRRRKKKAIHKLRVIPVMTDLLLNQVAESVQEHPAANILLVPVGAKFAEIEEKIAARCGE